MALSNSRKKDVSWAVDVDVNGRVSHGDAELSVLMDLRDALHEIRSELKTLNAVFACHNFQAVPGVLRRIDRRLQTRMLLSGERPKRRRPKED